MDNLVKGPWKQERISGFTEPERIRIYSKDGRSVAVFEPDLTLHPEVTRANADLITAAPELYATLGAFMEAALDRYSPLWNAYNKGRELLDRLNCINAEEDEESGDEG